MLFETQVGQVTAVARKNFGLRERRQTFLIRIAKKKFPCFDRPRGAGGRGAIEAFNRDLRKTIAIAEVFVRVVEGRYGFEIQSGEQFDGRRPRKKGRVILPAALALGDIAREQDDDRVKIGASDVADPMPRMVCASSTDDFGASGHALAEFLRKGGERSFVDAESLQSVPGESHGDPPGVELA